MHETFAAGFVEVKPLGMTSNYFLTHKDMLRLATFCTDTIDRGEIKCTLGVQAVGMFNKCNKNKPMLINISQVTQSIFTCALYIMKASIPLFALDE